MKKMNMPNKARRAYNFISEVDKAVIWLCFMIAIVTGIEPYINLIMITLILEELTADIRVGMIIQLIVIMITLTFFVRFLIVFLNNRKNNKTFLSEHKFREMKTKKFMEVSFEQLETQEFEDIRQGIRHSDESMGTFPSLIDNFQNMFSQMISIIVALWVLVSLFVKIYSAEESKSIYITLALFLLIFVTAILTHITVKMQRKSEADLPILYNQINANNRLGMYLAETVIYNYNAGKDIRLYHMSDFIGDEFDRVLKKAKPLMKDISRTTTIPGAMGGVSSAIIGGLVYSLVGLYATAGYLSIGSVVLYANSVKNLIGYITALIFQYGQIGVLLARMQPTINLLEMPNEGVNKTVERIGMSKDLEIVFDKVSFQYPNCKDWALNKVSFILSSNNRTAIVGTNGAGKTTVIKLICRLYKPQEGKILLNGINIEDWPLDEYRNLLAIVFQDFKLFSFSIGQNLSISEQYNWKEAEIALNKTGFSNRLETLPLKLDTPLYNDFDDEGIELSGGEAQKIAIGRLLYKNAPIMILDEPTSALDPIAEAEVNSKINTLIKDKLVIFISHRLSSCKFCDNILVFANGELVQSGSHASLLKDNNGMYYRLWEAQAQHYR